METNETVEQVCESICELVIAIHDKEHNEKQEIKNVWSIVQQVKDRILAAHKREINSLMQQFRADIVDASVKVMADERRATDSVIMSLRDEIEKLRALVAELADMLCFVSDDYCKENCTTTKGEMIRYCEDHPEYFCLANHYRALVAKAREVCHA